MTERFEDGHLEQSLNEMDGDGRLQSAFENSRANGPRVDVQELVRNGRPEITPVTGRVPVPASRYIPIAVGACIFLAVCLLPFWPGTDQGNSLLAWGDLMQQVDEIRSVQFKEVETFPGSDNQTEVRRVMILGRHRQRVEQITEKSFQDLIGDAINGGAESTPSGSILISNLQTGKIVALYPDRKCYTLLAHEVVVDDDGNQVSKTEIEAQPEVDFYSRMRNIPEDARTDLGAKQIDGRDAVGFGVEKKWGTNERSEEYWIDTQTLLPLRIEISILRPDAEGKLNAVQTWTLSEFEFDQPMDETLFSTDPPEGYTEKEDAIFRVQPSDE